MTWYDKRDPVSDGARYRLFLDENGEQELARYERRCLNIVRAIGWFGFVLMLCAGGWALGIAAAWKLL